MTLALLASLAAAVLPLQTHAQRRLEEQELRQALRALRTAIDVYKDNVDAGRLESKPGDSGYPPELAALAKPLTDRSTSTPRKWQLMRRIPRDPMCHCPDRPAEATWAIETDNTENMYDVRSRSTLPGLNGAPYDQW